MPIIVSNLSTLPPTCDEEATTRGGKSNKTICGSIFCASLCRNLKTKAAYPLSSKLLHYLLLESRYTFSFYNHGFHALHASCARLPESSVPKDNNWSPRCHCNAWHKPTVHIMVLRSMAWPNMNICWPLERPRVVVIHVRNPMAHSRSLAKGLLWVLYEHSTPY